MKKILSIFIALIFLVTSIGMNFSIHYCGGQVEKVAIGNDEISCGMDMSVNSCPSANQLSSSCCSNKHLQLKIKDNYLKPQVENSQVSFASFFTIIQSVVIVDISTQAIATFNHFLPLLLKQSLSILFQVFLI